MNDASNARCRARSSVERVVVVVVLAFVVVAMASIASIAFVAPSIVAFRARARVASSCARARGRRSTQEDACVAFASTVGARVVVVGVFDGHDGDDASAFCAREVARVVTSSDDAERWIAALDEAYATTNASATSSSGTTAIVVEANGEMFALEYVGDSAAYVCSIGVDGAIGARAERATSEHAASNASERERGRERGMVVVKTRDGYRANGEYLLTRAIGGVEHKRAGVVAEAERVERAWESGDAGLVVVTDGVIERLSADAVCSFVFAGRKVCEGGNTREDVIALGGDVGEARASSDVAWDEVEFETSRRAGRSKAERALDDGIERALKCALALGSTDNVAIAALTSGASAREGRVANAAKRKPTNETDVPRIGSRVAAYEITDMVAWSSGPFVPAAIPTLEFDYYELLSSGAQIRRRIFEQSAIEGALAALALAPGADERDASMFSAITSYIDIDVDDDMGNEFEEETFSREPFARGHFGEVWRARIFSRSMDESVMDCKTELAVDVNDDNAMNVILKRILIDQSDELRLSGAREVHFGKRLCGASPYLARFMHTFERSSGNGRDQWIAFKDEGESLERLMYASHGSTSGLQLVTQSLWWRDMRSSELGRMTLKTILKQIFTALDVCHAKFGVTHRDIKPGNIFVRLEGDVTQARLGDFGSAIDAHARDELYGPDGPTEAQETPEYSPPEVLFARVDVERTDKYDMWSLGVLTTELLVLGSPKAFSQVSRKTRLILERELRGLRPEARAVAYRLRAMLELCILPPEVNVAPLLSWECTETALMAAFRSRDPLGAGFATVWELRLVRKLLSWDPSERCSAGQALEHAFFREDARGWRCADGASTHEHEFKFDCERECGSPCN